jgi:hypothetical protein
MMKALLYYWDETQHDLAREALRKAGRADLIGHGPKCLVPPPRRGAPASHPTPGRPFHGRARRPDRDRNRKT